MDFNWYKLLDHIGKINKLAKDHQFRSEKNHVTNLPESPFNL